MNNISNNDSTLIANFNKILLDRRNMRCFFKSISSTSQDIRYDRFFLGLSGGGPYRIPKQYVANSTNFDSDNDILSSLLYKGWHCICPNIFELYSEHFKSLSNLSNLSNYGNYWINSLSEVSIKSLINLFPDILPAIKKYLGTKKVYILKPRILSSYPQPYSETFLSQNAMRWHRDYDGLKAVKLFINLNSFHGGSHYYVEGSHVHDFQQGDLFDLKYKLKYFSNINIDRPIDLNSKYDTFICDSKISDNTILKLFDSKSIISYPTHAGYAWLEDTFGLHKGSPSTIGQRSILSIIFTRSPFF